MPKTALIVFIFAGCLFPASLHAAEFKIDASAPAGKVSALNGVQSGPIAPNKKDPDLGDHYREGGVNLVRLPQDLGFLDGFGQDYALTLGDVFPNRELPADNPKHYNFKDIDRFIEAVVKTGATPLWQAIYDIGGNSNRWAADNANQAGDAPRDPKKWAEVIVNVLRHFNDGWADGHKWDVRYVEFPNEPCSLGGYDCGVAARPGKSGRPGRNRMYQDFATLAFAIDEYNKRYGHEVQLVGLGLPVHQAKKTLAEFLKSVDKFRVPFTIFSYHDYAWPDSIYEDAKEIREFLDNAGRSEVQLWNTEWNWPIYEPAPEELSKIMVTKEQRASFVAAHNAQVKTLVQGLWDEAFVYKAARAAARPPRPNPGEFFYFYLDTHPKHKPGTPKLAYRGWQFFKDIASRTPQRLNVEGMPANPTVLAAADPATGNLGFIMAYFCVGTDCIESDPVKIELRGVKPDAKYEAEVSIITPSSETVIEQKRKLDSGGDGTLTFDASIDRWSVQYWRLTPK